MTRDQALAQFLLYRTRRCVVVMGDDHRPVFSFVESPDLRTDVDEYSRATVSVSAYDRAGAMLRKLIREARFRRIAWEERLVKDEFPRSSHTEAQGS